MENFFDLGRRAAEAGCLKPGKAPDQACLARVLKESGIAEQRASCGELSWLPAGEGP
ncbi:hypothetical protein [Phenylobacterium sp. J367]|uniref:hypothetical protein n=1 Tax=Phenylobacterium sp. J367 TaxID=2898435 RepID=UPI002150A0E0|nr:hypothetical protein [Phenylobacterium sp. J367]MCR5880815.1 hypothetical protein [Phenylobacterium sp. J367]